MATDAQTLLEGPPPGQSGQALGQPRIEVVTGGDQGHGAPLPERSAGSLALWFLAAFALVLLPATVWNLSRPPVYRATATVLTTVPAERSGAGRSDADVQHVAIQRQLLLGRQLLADTIARVDAAGGDPPPTPDDLRPLLTVDAVPGTNLVELSAEGGLPLLLSDIVNAWLASYEGLRQAEIEARLGTRLEKLAEQGDSLETQIAAKRAALTAFREQRDIVTLERDSNRALNRLNTLQASLAEAEDAQIKARARLMALESAAASGAPVIVDEAAATLAQLQQQEAELAVRVQELQKRYTEMFIQNDPDKRALPEQLKRLRARIATVGRQGAEAALTEARRAVETTTDRRLRLERELADQKRVASRFTADFEAYKDLEADLAALDDMQRSTQGERVALETQAIDGYPQIEIIEPAHPPRDPVRPHYGRDFGISAAAAAGAGLLTVLGLLLLDASRRPRRGLPMTGVRIWGDDAGGRAAGAPQLPPYAPPGQLGQAPGGLLGRGPAPLGALPDATTRQLMGGEVEALWELADDAERQVMGLLLCGLDLPEIAQLTMEDFDLRESELRVPTDARRVLLPPALADLFKDAHPLPAWRSPDEAVEIAARIPLLAVDAGLAHAAEVTPEVLRHTYLAYLVRQGARLTELHRVAGRLDSASVQRYAPLSPAGASRPIGQVDLAYPLLA
jgi:polysaccharide biosynthesis transport protein